MLVEDKIINFLKFNGPSLAISVSKHLGEDNLISSAYLSELVSRKKVKISNIKIGTSPLYFLDGQEDQLVNFTSELKAKDREILLNLKDQRVLRESELDLLHKVVLRSLKDFAVPLHVTFDGKKELFWRWHLLSLEDSNKLISSFFEREIQERVEVERAIAHEKAEATTKIEIEKKAKEEALLKEEEEKQAVLKAKEDRKKALEKKKKEEEEEAVKKAEEERKKDLEEKKKALEAKRKKDAEELKKKESLEREEKLKEFEALKIKEEEKKKKANAKKRIESYPLNTTEKEVEEEVSIYPPVTTKKKVNKKKLVKAKVKLDPTQEKLVKEDLADKIEREIKGVEPEKEDSIVEKIKKKITRKRKSDDFLTSILQYLKSINIEVVDHDVVRKNAEINLTIKASSVVGTMTYYCKAKNKLRCDDRDISAAYMESQIKKMPLLFLYPNDISKKAQELLNSGAFDNLMAKKMQKE